MLSTVTVAALKKISLRRIYQVLAVLCITLLALYTLLAIIFLACTTVIAAQAVPAMWATASTATLGSISLATTLVGGLCIWIPIIILCCRHLLVDYLEMEASIIVAVIVLAGEITILTYTTLWAILFCGQVCMLYYITTAIEHMPIS